MSLASEYQRQRAWRSWDIAFATLPELAGQELLDLGCGVGDLAAELAVRGAHVLGLDANDELLAAASSRAVPRARFEKADLRQPLALGQRYDGIWSSFLPAFFSDLRPRLEDWRAHLRPGGWIALTEIDDLFAHEPLESGSRALLEAYADDALRAGRYDFRMGRRLPSELEGAGFELVARLELPDLELAFDGPARPEVLEAWRSRLERMSLLHAFAGAEAERLQEAFLACLAHPRHHARARVAYCLGRRRD